MSKIGIIITNPNHHLQLTLDVAQKLKESGQEVHYISFCELRRMYTPREEIEKSGFSLSIFPSLPSTLKTSTGAKSLGPDHSWKRKLVHNVFWLGKIRPFLKSSIKDVKKVILLNDVAFPGNRIVQFLHNRNIPFFLLQEGIRFPMPKKRKQDYGAGGAKIIFAWGERSALHFQKIKQDETQILVCGSPRQNRFLESLKLDGKKQASSGVIGLFTNPIDDQGFCDPETKYSLVQSLVRKIAPQLEKNKFRLLIKCHPREDVNAYLNKLSPFEKFIYKGDNDIISCLKMVDAGFIMASTVGLELLSAGKPIAQLEIPGYGFVFDYVEGSAAIPVHLNQDFDLSKLLDQAVNETYLNSHFHQGESAKIIAETLLQE